MDWSSSSSDSSSDSDDSEIEEILFDDDIEHCLAWITRSLGNPKRNV